jgi:DNA-binding SARP family transcriptional activator
VRVNPTDPVDLNLKFLGSPAWRRGQQAPRPIAERDALLLLLLVDQGSLKRARAAAWLWPDSPPRQAGISLRQRIFRLKRTMGADVVVGDAAIRLAGGLRHDLEGLEDGLRADPDHATGGLLEGLLLDDGMDDLAEWLERARARWCKRRQDALAGLAEMHAAGGRLAAALRYAERLVVEAPEAEHAHRRLMRLHHLRGDRAAALAAYRRCTEWMRRELGATPGAETRALASMLEGETAPAPPPTAAPAPLALLRPPRMVGRHPVLQRIAQAWLADRVVLVSGEPGIGKSRLLAEHAAGQSWPLIELRPGDADAPYGAAARVVRDWWRRVGAPGGDAAWAVREWARFLPELGLSAVGDASTQRLQRAFMVWAEHAVAAGVQAVVVDDLQFADAASLDALLCLLAASNAGPRLRWLIAVRANERPTVLDAWLATSAADQVEELPLDALEPDAVADLLRSLELPGLDAASWAQALWRHVGGNPFFTLQTLLACGPDAGLAPPDRLPLPRHLGQLVQRRLRQLSPSAWRLAQLAALSEASFSVALAARVLECHALALAPLWSELEAAQVLRDGAFAHDLMREAVAALVPAAVARVLHGQLADALTATPPDAGVSPARLARHLEAAGRWPAAGRQHLAAAQLALQAGRRREQADALAAAVHAFGQAGDGVDDELALQALGDRVGALVQSAEAAELPGALAALRRAADRAGRGWLAEIVAAEVQIVFGEFDAVIAAMPAASRQAQADGDPENACLAARRQATAMAHAGQPAAAIELLQAWLPRVDTVLGLRARGEFHGELGTLLERADRRADGARHLNVGIELALQASDPSTAATAFINLGVNRLLHGEPEAAVQAAQRGIALRQEVDASGGLGLGFEMTLGGMLRDCGDYAEALPRLERALAGFEADGNLLWAVNTRTQLGLLWCQLGQWGRALQVLQPAADGAPAFLQARRLAVLAQVRSGLGLPDADSLAQARQLIGSQGRADIRLAIELQWLGLQPASQAIDGCVAVAEEAAARELHGHRVAAQAAGLEAALRLDRPPLHPSLAEDARALTIDAGRWMPPGSFRPALWWTASRALEAAGCPIEAAGAAQAGRAWIRRSLVKVPAPWRDSFLHRNAVVAALRACKGVAGAE